MKVMFKKMKKQLEEENRKYGIDIVGNVPWGTHFCQFYRTKKDLIDILVPYFKAGLENNEFCMWVTSEPLMVEEAKAALKKVVKNLDNYIKNGQIEILDYTKWYTKTGKFEADKVLQGWVKKEEQAIKKGFDGIRITGNTSWLEKKDWKNFLDYEVAVDNTINNHQIIAICSYFLDKCRTSEVIDVVSTHQLSLIKRNNRWISVESTGKKKIEDKIKELEEKYKTIFEGANEGILIADIKTKKFIFTNPAICKITGYSSKELLKLNVNDIHPKKDLPHVLGEFKKQAQGKKILAKNIPILRKDKKLVYCDISSRPIKIGKQELMLGFFRDITERKEVEQALQGSEERFKSIVESAPSMLVITNGEGRHTYISPQCEEMVGYTQEELLVKPTWWVHEDDTARAKEAFGHTFREGVGGRNLEYKAVKKNGEVWYASSSWEPLKNHEGRVVAIISQTINITERKKAEEEIKENEEKWNSLTQNTNDIIMIVDNKGKIQYINRTISPYTPKDIVGKSVYEYVPKEQHDAMRNSLTNVFKTGKPESYVVSSVIPKLGAIWFSTKVIPIQYDGKVVNTILISSDITEQKKAQEEIASAWKYSENLIENIPSAILVFNDKLKCTSANWTYHQTFKKDIKHIKGNDITPALPSGMIIKHHLDEKVKEVLKTGKTIELPKCQYDSEIYNVKIVKIMRGKAEEEEEERFVMVIIDDVTEQRKAQEEIKKARDELTEKVAELERFNRLAVGRELKMIELKKRIGELERQLDKG